MMNLLKNAFHYSLAKIPGVEIFSNENYIQLTFLNDGEAIPEHERVKIFTHLFRGENSRNKKGFGLGLVLVHRIISLHNGAISYVFTEECKNVFVVKLPLA